MANIVVKSKVYKVDPVYQWDTNQQLVIYGLSLPYVPEIHFTNDAMNKAIVRKASMDSAGVITVMIPNPLLQQPYKIKAYVCRDTGVIFKSEYQFVIPVKPRNKPGDYILYASDDEVYSFRALELSVENALKQIVGAAEYARQAETAFANIKALLKDFVDDLDALIGGKKSVSGGGNVGGGSN